MKTKEILKKIYIAGFGNDVLKVKVILVAILFFIYLIYKFLYL